LSLKDATTFLSGAPPVSERVLLEGFQVLLVWLVKNSKYMVNMENW
jgi:hypothetical protein